MPTIRERAPGVFEIRVFVGNDAGGRPVQTSRTVRGSRRQAEKVAAQLSVKAPPRSAGRTVADALEAWLEINLGTWAPSTARDQLSRARAIANDPIAKVPLARIGVADVERWYARMRRLGVGEGAVRNRNISLRAALTQAESWSWLSVNPARLARLRHPKRQQRGVMTPEEVATVLSAALALDVRAGLALRLAAVAGLRRSELAALQFTDLRGAELMVDSAVAVVARGTRSEPAETVLRDDPTKTGTARSVTLDDGTLSLLARVRLLHSGERYIFGDGEAMPNPDRISWWWTRSRHLAAIDRQWRLHDLRHFSASMAIAAGHDVRSVAGRLGHANPAMTLRTYAHAVPGGDARIADDFGRLLPLDGLSSESEQPERGSASS
jgi:integrase